MPTKIDMAKFASFCKDMGFIYQSSEIYGGINGFWDYGPLGVELKKNIKDAWWLDMVVFGIYQVTFIVMLFRMIRREDFGDGPLPDRAQQKAVAQ